VLPAELKEAAKRFLTARAGAYSRTFNLESVDVQVVLADLAKFCRAHQSTAHPDPHMAARLDGRREAWLRIAEHLHLTTEELYHLYAERNKKPGV